MTFKIVAFKKTAALRMSRDAKDCKIKKNRTLHGFNADQRRKAVQKAASCNCCLELSLLSRIKLFFKNMALELRKSTNGKTRKK